VRPRKLGIHRLRDDIFNFKEAPPLEPSTETASISLSAGLFSIFILAFIFSEFAYEWSFLADLSV
jgi:hypothetical protein